MLNSTSTVAKTEDHLFASQISISLCRLANNYNLIKMVAKHFTSIWNLIQVLPKVLILVELVTNTSSKIPTLSCQSHDEGEAHHRVRIYPSRAPWSNMVKKLIDMFLTFENIQKSLELENENLGMIWLKPYPSFCLELSSLCNILHSNPTVQWIPDCCLHHSKSF